MKPAQAAKNDSRSMVNRDTGTIAQWAGSGLLVALALVYANITPYLNAVPGAQSAVYAAMLVLLILSIDGGIRIRRNIASVLPYAGFILIYFLWGEAVGADHGGPVGLFPREVVIYAAVLGGLAVSVRNRQRLAMFSELIQAASILNLVVCLWELAHPNDVSILVRLATVTSLHSAPDYHAITDLRPGGLWGNANEAGFAFLIGVLLSYWSRRSWRWAGFAAGAAGIFITASRTAAYLLIFCAIAYLIHSAWHSRRDESARKEMTRWASLIVVSLVLLLTLATGSLDRSLEGLGGEWHGGRFDRVGRLLDFEQKDAGSQARAAVTQRYLRRALAAPWYGYGLFTFTAYYGGAFSDIGAHDIYLTVWGETGPLMLLAYLLVLTYGVGRCLHAAVPAPEKLTIGLIWVSWLVIGFFWHNQFTEQDGIIYAGLLFLLPNACSSGDPGLSHDERSQQHTALAIESSIRGRPGRSLQEEVIH